MTHTVSICAGSVDACSINFKRPTVLVRYDCGFERCGNGNITGRHCKCTRASFAYCGNLITVRPLNNKRVKRIVFICHDTDGNGIADGYNALIHLKGTANAMRHIYEVAVDFGNGTHIVQILWLYTYRVTLIACVSIDRNRLVYAIKSTAGYIGGVCGGCDITLIINAFKACVIWQKFCTDRGYVWGNGQGFQKIASGKRRTRQLRNSAT